MKQTLYILILIFLTSCGNIRQNQENEELSLSESQIEKVDEQYETNILEEIVEGESSDNNDFQMQTLANEFTNAKLYSLKDTILADFNGDDNIDEALFIKEKETSGIIIKHGFTNDETRIGFGRQFAHLTDFNWVDFWGLVNDSISYEILFNEFGIIGDTTVRLNNPSIVVRKEEVGGGLISFKNGKYIWIHQSD